MAKFNAVVKYLVSYNKGKTWEESFMTKEDAESLKAYGVLVK